MALALLSRVVREEEQKWEDVTGKYDGNPETFPQYRDELQEKIENCPGGFILSSGYILKEHPMQAYTDREYLNAGWIIMGEDQERQMRKTISEYETFANADEKYATMVLGTIKATMGSTVKGNLKDQLEMQGTARDKVIHTLRELDGHFRQYSTAIKLRFEEKLQNMGRCIDEEDVKYVMNAIDSVKKNLGALSKANGIQDCQAIGDEALKARLIRRMPTEDVFWELLTADIDKLEKWEEITKYVRRRILNRLPTSKPTLHESSAMTTVAVIDPTKATGRQERNDNICRHWKSTGKCTFSERGNTCRFIHEGENAGGRKEKQPEKRPRSSSPSPNRNDKGNHEKRTRFADKQEEKKRTKEDYEKAKRATEKAKKVMNTYKKQQGEASDSDYYGLSSEEDSD
jgi:hypothetical protein